MATKKLVLTEEYVQEHLSAVHNFESLGRNLCAAILEATLERVKASPKEKLEFTAKITVTPTEREPIERACIFALIEVEGKPVWVHIYTNPQ